MIKDLIFVLFMSHKSGGHGITVHRMSEQVVTELDAVLDVIHENSAEDDEDKKTDSEELQKFIPQIEQLTDETDSIFIEFSDSTWATIKVVAVPPVFE